jgi:hypothetical protein
VPALLLVLVVVMVLPLIRLLLVALMAAVMVPVTVLPNPSLQRLCSGVRSTALTQRCVAC